MIKFRKGNTRYAFIFFGLFVIKVPNLRWDWIIDNYKRNGLWICIKKLPNNLYQAMLLGVVANVTEALIYQFKGFSCLSPVFSIALANFQRYEGEDIPTQQEILDLFSRYEIVLYDQKYNHDAHASGYYNWRKTKRGLTLIDYGVDPVRDNWICLLQRLDNCIKGEKIGMKLSDLYESQ